MYVVLVFRNPEIALSDFLAPPSKFYTEVEDSITRCGRRAQVGAHAAPADGGDAAPAVGGNVAVTGIAALHDHDVHYEAQGAYYAIGSGAGLGLLREARVVDRADGLGDARILTMEKETCEKWASYPKTFAFPGISPNCELL